MKGFTTKTVHVNAVRFEGDPGVYQGLIKAWHTPEGDEADGPRSPWNERIATPFYAIKIKDVLTPVNHGDWIVLIHKMPMVLPHKMFKVLFVSYAERSDARAEAKKEETARLDREQPIPHALLEECRKFLGKPPYNGMSNYVQADPYFARSLEKKYDPALLKRAMERVSAE